MKILQIFNRYAFMGGEEIAVEQIGERLAKSHEFREVSFDSRDWVDKTDLLNRARQFLSMAWNPESIRTVRKEIDEFHPDLILLHNIMPIGSAALSIFLANQKTPVIQYIHNFRPFSVNGYCWGGGRLLPEGLEKNFIPEILAGSWQNSPFKTSWYGLIIRILHWYGAYRRVDGWIAISHFIKEKFVEGGIDEDRIQIIPHCWELLETGQNSPIAEMQSEPVFLFLGRITEEKGLNVLLDAWEIFKESSLEGRLLIAGDGPMSDEIQRRCAGMRDVTFLGFQSGENKNKLLRECTALVVPSIWWEPSGLVVYEAYDFGKPVLAARSGGIVDNVTHGITGWLHEPGNAGMLASQMLEAGRDPADCRFKGNNGREFLRLKTPKSWMDSFDDFARVTLLRCREKIESHSPNSRYPNRSDVVISQRGGIKISVYLADQNPGYDRSFGISRMTRVLMEKLQQRDGLLIEAISSRTSQQAPEGTTNTLMLPWGTRRKWIRLLTDHFHPLFWKSKTNPDIHYFPKGYLPLLHVHCQPSVVTIHDTIIQYDEDHYPDWRPPWEYSYWARILKHTLRNATRILTVSQSAKRQITEFMERHSIPPKPITVTYEPCAYEPIPQPLAPLKSDFIIHLASTEPHKRTAQLISWWLDAEAESRQLPQLHLIGTLPPDLLDTVKKSTTIVKRPFLEDEELQSVYTSARALVLPSEIEGFGLPALEAFYLGSPVCYVRGTSVEEILSVATSKGGFCLEDRESFFSALDEAMAMEPDEIRECGLILRKTYAASKISERMVKVFREVASTPLD